MVSENIQARMKFIKTGSLKFISHLDLDRTMKSALLRAKIPIWYSQGFNPRPKIVFSLPLSIGVESVCEFVDIRLVEFMDYDEIKRRINATLTAEMSVMGVYEPQTKLSDIGYAEYNITFDDKIDTEKLKSPLIITKKTKNGDKTIDIQPLIKRYIYDGNILTALLNAESANYLNPDYLAKALSNGGYDIIKINTYFKDALTLFK